MPETWDDDLKLLNALKGGGTDAAGFGRSNPVMRDFFAAQQGMTNMRVNQERLNVLAEAQQERKNLTNALRGVDISSQTGMEEAIGRVGQVNPLSALKLRQELTKGNAEERKARTEALKNMVMFNDAAIKQIGGNFQGYVTHYNWMKQNAPELGQTMAPPQAFVENNNINMGAFNNYMMRITNANEVAKLALTPPKVVGKSLVHGLTGEEIYRAPEEETTILSSETGQPVGKVKGKVAFTPKPTKESFDEQAYKEWLGSNPGKSRMDYLQNKKEISSISDEDTSALVDGLKAGTIAPEQLSKRATSYNNVVAKATKEGVDLAKAQNQFNAAKRAVASLNSQQQTRLKGLGISVVNTIDEMLKLSKEMNLSGFHPLNYAEIQGKVKAAGNTKAGQLASQYLAATTFLREEVAQLAMGGYAPTEPAFKLATQQVNENYGVKQMHSSLGELQRLVNYRIKAFDEITPTYIKGQGTTPAAGALPDTMPIPGGGNAQKITGQLTPEGHQLYKFPDGSKRPWIPKR